MPKPPPPDAASQVADSNADSARERDMIPIVGIGASAGGLEAFTQLLSGIPPDTGMGFVLVQHLDPGHESHLCDLLSRATKMAVAEASDGHRIAANHVYVIPPGFTLTVIGGILRLTPRGMARPHHLPIDMFFRSLAGQGAGKIIGIVLSGTGSDGTQGLEEIKAAGGITFAQEPRSAGHPGMPQSAIDEGLADFVLAPAEIAMELARLSGTESFRSGPADGQAGRTEEEAFAAVLELLRSSMNVDFTQYRDSTLKRRIQRRMILRRIGTLSAYAALLAEDKREIESLYQDVLINVTRFFRDPEVFEAVKRDVFPVIAEGKSAANPIRIWVTGCSSGQEAYTLAILLMEYLADSARPPPIQIFASDLKEAGTLEKARLGLYPDTIEADVSVERLNRFFTKELRGYRIRKEIRELCVFAKHDLVADPPFSRVDLIACRNVLIYMSPTLQRKVIPIFHYALNPGGFLLLGSSESVGRDSRLFRIVDRERKIYARGNAVSSPPRFMSKRIAPGSAALTAQPGRLPVTQSDFRREADRILLGRFPPASVLVNGELEILQFRGRTSPYLEPAQGASSFNLLRMANESLFLVLRDAVQEAQAGDSVVRKSQVRVRDEGRIRTINLEIIPVKLPVSTETCFLILFLETDGVAEAGTAPPAATERAPEAASQPAADSEEVLRLRREVASLREYLQSLREQHDAAIEELKSANEEMLSSNEELQSTNEEMETGREEYQSANEELTTVNEEIALRNHEMGLLSNDLNNLLNSINIPVVIVGGDLRIRRFTAAAANALHLLPPDVGRSLGDLHFDMPGYDLGKAVKDVIATGTHEDHEVRNRDGRWQSLRIHPYKTPDEGIDGAVIILMDIDVLKTFQDKLLAAEEYASSIVSTVRKPLLILRGDLRINSANAAFYRMFGSDPDGAEGKTLFGHGKGVWDTHGLKRLVEDCFLRDEPFDDFAMEFNHPEEGLRDLLLNGRVLLREKGKARMVLIAMEDVTERKRAHEILTNQGLLLERAVRERTAELQTSNEDMEAFSYSVSHDLRAPLRAMRGYAEALRDDFGGQADEKCKEYIRRIVQSGERMDRLILDVLTYSQAAHSEIPIQPVDLDVLVTEVLRANPDLQGPGVDIAVVGRLGSVMGHEPALGQCLSNLLLNAVKFVAPGTSPIIRIRSEAIGADLRLWVEDNGIGIAPEHRERIFGMFEKLHAGNAYAGTGIGLAIVKKSMERMGGKAGVESETGAGSRFWLQLPDGRAA